MNEPKYELTVLMPAYNAANYIAEAIESVLGQTYTQFEFLIIDDGSTDTTKEIIRSYSDPRIKLIATPHRGISKALNKGLHTATGDYIARFDADDICLPHRLQRQLSFLKNESDYILVGSDVAHITSKGEYLFTHNNPAYADAQIKQLAVDVCPFVHSSVCYKKEAVIKAGAYDENAHSFEDLLLWRKLMWLGKVSNIKEVLVLTRFNPESFTIDEKWRGNRFRQIKLASLHRGFTTEHEGNVLLSIIREQETSVIKNGSYHALIGKKYLWNTYNPPLARKNLMECWCQQRRMILLLLWCISFLPQSVISFIYKSIKKSTAPEKVLQK